MSQTREGLRFVTHATASRSSIPARLGLHDLQSHAAPELRVPREIDDAHPSAADALQDLVAPRNPAARAGLRGEASSEGGPVVRGATEGRLRGRSANRGHLRPLGSARRGEPSSLLDVIGRDSTMLRPADLPSAYASRCSWAELRTDRSRGCRRCT